MFVVTTNCLKEDGIRCDITSHTAPLFPQPLYIVATPDVLLIRCQRAKTSILTGNHLVNTCPSRFVSKPRQAVMSSAVVTQPWRSMSSSSTIGIATCAMGLSSRICYLQQSLLPPLSCAPPNASRLKLSTTPRIPVLPAAT
jgi:hypothetical protein